jgi:hypothetical protein
MRFPDPVLPGWPAGGEESDRPTPGAKAVQFGTYSTGNRVVEWCAYAYDFGDDATHDRKPCATCRHEGATMEAYPVTA